MKQENCGDEVKTSKNAVYICNKCVMTSERHATIQCTRPKQWYHDRCFKYCFVSLLNSNYLYCFKCIIVLYRNIGNFLTFHHNKNITILLQNWNTSGELSLQKFCIPRSRKIENSPGYY